MKTSFVLEKYEREVSCQQFPFGILWLKLKPKLYIKKFADYNDMEETTRNGFPLIRFY